MAMGKPIGRIEKQIISLLLFNLEVTGERECVSIPLMVKNITGVRGESVTQKIKSLEDKGLVTTKGDCVKLSGSVKVQRRR